MKSQREGSVWVALWNGLHFSPVRPGTGWTGCCPTPGESVCATAQHKACPGVGNNALPSYSFSTQLTCPEEDTVEAQRTHPTVRQ